MAKKKFKKDYKKVTYYVIEQDLSSEQRIDGVAMSILECLEERVSDELLELLKEMLLGIADDLLDFVHSHVIHTTGCISADAVLGSCYQWIAVEKGITIVRK